jgi:SAM-dependent methyltransferase
MLEIVLKALCRPVDSSDYAGGTEQTDLNNALDFLNKTVPGFLGYCHGKRVLDFGCGRGLQAAAIALASPTSSVVGVDLPRPVIQSAWKNLPAIPNLELTTTPPEETFDIVYSCSSFEHFDDPKAVLKLMHDRTSIGGLVVVSFAEPWFSPRGSHMGGFCRVPWLNLLFPESTVLRVRARYRSDGAKRYEDVEGGLNRMTVARFERLMQRSEMEMLRMNLFSVKNLPGVTHVPVLRELLTAAAACVLRRVR